MTDPIPSTARSSRPSLDPDVARALELLGESPSPALGERGRGILGALGRLHDDVAGLTVAVNRHGQQIAEVLQLVRALPAERTAIAPVAPKRKARGVWAGVAAVVVAIGTATAGVAQALRGTPPEVRQLGAATGGAP